MDLDQSSDDGVQDAGRLRESVSMALRQLQQPHRARAHSNEIPESDEGELEDRENDDNTEDEDGNQDIIDDINNPDDLDDQSQRSGQYSGSSVNSHDSHDSPSPSANTRPILPPPREPPPAPSPYSTVPPTPTHTYRSFPRKRTLSPTPYPSSTAAAEPPATTTATVHPDSPRPFKRHRTATFHPAYLALLNDDIRDAAQQFVPPTDDNPHPNKKTTLEPSQLGLTHWSSAEKTLFFEALARLGRDDAAGIAARVRTKGELEVAAYLALLRREGEGQGVEGEGGGGKREGVAPAEVPAAVELGQECVAALEEAADAVSVRVEGYEVAVERGRWGEGGWLVGAGNWRVLEGAPPEGLGGVLELFRVGNWLRLSGRVFMNSAVEEYNWVRVEGEEPAVRATALEDFYALAVQVTRRLVAATIFVAEERIRARRELYPYARNRVWKQDVEAAALSLGLPTDSRKFWAKCARRLRLDVYENEDATVMGWEDEGEDEQDPMSYDEVERALGLEPEATGPNTAAAAEDEETESSEEELDEAMISAEALTHDEDDAEREAITREMNEVLIHSALEYPKSGPQRDNLRRRIRAERAHEAYADKMDARASYYEEKRMWAMLERQPLRELLKPDAPEEPKKVT
ncbi:hypothetical protein F5144DRAFT_648788, partial [Chaetomium tenue]